MQHELVTNPIGHVDGWVSAPEGPGLGVDVDEAVVRRYRFREDGLAAERGRGVPGRPRHTRPARARPPAPLAAPARGSDRPRDAARPTPTRSWPLAAPRPERRPPAARRGQLEAEASSHADPRHANAAIRRRLGRDLPAMYGRPAPPDGHVRAGRTGGEIRGRPARPADGRGTPRASPRACLPCRRAEAGRLAGRPIRRGAPPGPGVHLRVEWRDTRAEAGRSADP